MQVTIDHLTKRFGSTTAVNDLSLTMEDGTLTALLGPSGCGKSTILNMLSGILPVTEGKILFDGKDVTDLPPEKRNVGLVFQNYALYPHMTVLENICFPLEIKRVPKKQRIARAMELADLVRIGDFLKRKPGELSGGQQQRVAIARTLALSPDIILFDEPMSALDVATRLTMREELKEIQYRFGTTMRYITPDQEEALSMSDRIMVMGEAEIHQIGTPDELLDSPADGYVKSFVIDNLRAKINSLSKFMR